jgi:hypothetical protein
VVPLVVALAAAPIGLGWLYARVAGAAGLSSRLVRRVVAVYVVAAVSSWLIRLIVWDATWSVWLTRIVVIGVGFTLALTYASVVVAATWASRGGGMIEQFTSGAESRPEAELAAGDVIVLDGRPAKVAHVYATGTQRHPGLRVRTTKGDVFDYRPDDELLVVPQRAPRTGRVEVTDEKSTAVVDDLLYPHRAFGVPDDVVTYEDAGRSRLSIRGIAFDVRRNLDGRSELWLAIRGHRSPVGGSPSAGLPALPSLPASSSANSDWPQGPAPPVKETPDERLPSAFKPRRRLTEVARCRDRVAREAPRPRADSEFPVAPRVSAGVRVAPLITLTVVGVGRLVVAPSDPRRGRRDCDLSRSACLRVGLRRPRRTCRGRCRRDASTRPGDSLERRRANDEDAQGCHILRTRSRDAPRGACRRDEAPGSNAQAEPGPDAAHRVRYGREGHVTSSREAKAGPGLVAARRRVDYESTDTLLLRDDDGNPDRAEV